MNVCASVETARGSGAIAIVRLAGPDLEQSLASLGLAEIGIGQVKLADFLGVDRGIAARWDQITLDLMIHGGHGVLKALLDRLHDHGITIASDLAPTIAWPEAADDIEARMLDMLSRARGTRTTDLLLAQPARWRAAPNATPNDAPALAHLLTPPLVAIWGPANIGKSTLVNRLARESVSVVADIAGTTRDAVSVHVQLDGLVVRLLDAPGVADDETDPLVLEATHIAHALASRASLILLCGDAESPAPPTFAPIRHDANATSPDSMLIALRADRGRPDWSRDLDVSALTGEGIEELAALVRERLVPDHVLADPRPWRFWAQSH
ncbi:MAG: 50S ribosome-binding GTPase [Phycisphaeraceae bacterium]|nr:50S ribosome-binding GTPase [Phycisphaeraceae bacterium]MCW5762276.1 50S ribosome-binding GTPase [Phycisphaeraceae bacterium]